MDNFEKNVKLLIYETSKKPIEDKLTAIYGEVDSDAINVVFYSLLFNVNQLQGNFSLMTRANSFVDLAKDLLPTKIIPIFKNFSSKEVIGYHLIKKRFFLITHNKPRADDYETINLFDKQTYIVLLQSSKINNYNILKNIDIEYMAKIDGIINFIQNDKKFRSILTKRKYNPNARKKSIFSSVFISIKITKLMEGIYQHLHQQSNTFIYYEEYKNFTTLIIIFWLNKFFNID